MPVIWHWTGLAITYLTLLPSALALGTGRVPRRLRSRLAPTRPHGRALLPLDTAAPLNAIPRLGRLTRTDHGRGPRCQPAVTEYAVGALAAPRAASTAA
jgi:hypothetical protein